MAVPLTDHPRSRGEYATLAIVPPPMLGSSPLSRGIQLLGVDEGIVFGIIPALAGNTPYWTCSAIARRDHPRSRGEYSSTGSILKSGVGSSPLSRGILDFGHDLRVKIGIIPALAGNTPESAEGFSVVEDHPRSRGEYRRYAVDLIGRAGSSPLSRGILIIHQRRERFARIIPALAGNTGGFHPRAKLSQDHPRSRGEYTPSYIKAVLLDGSSPLSRGILRHFRFRGAEIRIIPALAGNTKPL